MKGIGRSGLFLLVIVIFLAGCGKVDTGLQGKVVLATCSGSQIATECRAQSTYEASLTIYSKDLAPLRTYKTNGDGTFLIALKAGTYYVHPVPPVQGQFPMAADFKVTVTQGKLTDLTIYYDTGERPAPTQSP